MSVAELCWVCDLMPPILVILCGRRGCGAMMKSCGRAPCIRKAAKAVNVHACRDHCATPQGEQPC